jgi:predicted RNase H-like nuclease (RuvC/YqgF family)
MSQEVVGWLKEIKNLQQQVKAAQVSEQSAHASADNWRKRYEIEAGQRRDEVQTLQATIAQLKAELDRAQNPLASEMEVESSIAQIQTVPELQAKLIEVWSDRNQLAQDLETEQVNHIETRKSLTTALGDAVEMLAKVKVS